MELKEKIIYDNKYGLVVQKVEDCYKDTILKTLLKNTTKKEEISEKIRLLYVAVTRAKEKMIIVMPEQEEQQEVFDLVPSYERYKYNSFLSIVKSIYSALLPYEIKKDVKVTRDYQTSSSNLEIDIKQPQKKLEVVENIYEETFLEESHYSKESLHLITKDEKETMEFGTKVHETLEHMDFKNPSNYLNSLPKNIKEKIEKFLQTPIIKENLSSKMYKEYEFTYQEDTSYSHGIIDLLIERPDKIIIIDYKLKNINDESYDKQLNGYRKVIENKTSKIVECYLYSILDNEFRKVEEK